MKKIIDFKQVKMSAAILRSLNHELRQKMLQTIIDNGNRKTVTEIYNKMGLEQSLCSQHLAILRKQGIVTTDRDGKFLYYSVDNVRIEQISAAMSFILN
jgi:DNA-binding transcriptional ArsR family regulator